MPDDFLHGTLGRTGLRVHRLGLSATYRPGTATVFRAAERGINFFFGFGFDTHLTRALRELFRADRERYVLATGAYNLIIGSPDVRRTLEKRLRQFRTDYIDAFLFLGVMNEREFPAHVREELYRLRDEKKVRYIGISTHDRRLAGRLADEGALDLLMIRYNAAHRGAEQEIFPHTHGHDPGIISYTATRWTYLLRRPRRWPSGERIPTAGEAYRFVLSNPNVDVCLTAPRSLQELEQNLTAAAAGPLPAQEMGFMRAFGDAVHHTKKWFM